MVRCTAESFNERFLHDHGQSYVVPKPVRDAGFTAGPIGLRNVRRGVES